MNIREMIDATIGTGDIAYQNREYRKAYFEYDGALSLLNTLDIKEAKNQTIGSIAGWTAGFLTGGIGLEDLFIIPLVKGGVTKMMGSDNEYLKFTLQGVLLKQINALLMDEKLSRNLNLDSVLIKFCMLIVSFTPESVLTSAGKFYLPRFGKERYFNNPDFTIAPSAYLEARVSEVQPEFDNIFRLLFRYLTLIDNSSQLKKNLDAKYNRQWKTNSQSSSSQDQSPPPNDRGFNTTLTEEECFAVLQVAPGSSKEEIKTAYLKLSKLYHPDKYAHLAPEFQELAGERMKTINQAYNTLINR